MPKRRERDLVAVITGGDSGIGRAVAIAFAREGADVAISFLSEKEEEDAAETVRWIEEAGRRASAARLNVQKPRECARFVDRVAREFGRVDILVNNASRRSSSRGRSGRTSSGSSTWCRPRCRT